MDDNIFQLTKDFYTLKAEYQVNMQQLQRNNSIFKRDVELLTKSFNELRDAVAENVDRLNS